MLLDPRGRNLPFRQDVVIPVRTGQLVLFPAWMAHQTTATSTSADAGKMQRQMKCSAEGECDEVEENNDLDDDVDPGLRIAMAFNVAPKTGAVPPAYWDLDPVAKMALSSREAVGLDTLREDSKQDEQERVGVAGEREVELTERRKHARRLWNYDANSRALDYLERPLTL